MSEKISINIVYNNSNGNQLFTSISDCFRACAYNNIEVE